MQEVHQFYGQRLRIRVCGIFIQGNKILMVRHNLDGRKFWAPPGGGMEFGESATDCLIREVKEETGLLAKPGELLFVTEYQQNPLHAIELFFSVSIEGGWLQPGHDPELPDHAVIEEVKTLSWEEIKSIPPQMVHGIFQKAKNLEELSQLKGYFKL